ncbi:MAG TPA: hypothetical protein VD995_04620 [Azospirillum sp.]|nr:hypothetical protein [Azospirillum sp.]
MSTLGQLKARIARKLSRDDMTDEIADAIQAAIRHYQRRRFTFNEARATTITAAGTEYYDLPSNLIEIDVLKLADGDRTEPLTPRDYAWMDGVSSQPSHRGEPSDYAVFAGQLRLYPIPDGVYTLAIAYVKRLPALASDSDGNAWTDDAQDLICFRALADLYGSELRDLEMAAAMETAARQILEDLTGDTLARVSTGRLRPTAF